jgi:hypothetical protein
MNAGLLARVEAPPTKDEITKRVAEQYAYAAKRDADREAAFAAGQREGATADEAAAAAAALAAHIGRSG